MNDCCLICSKEKKEESLVSVGAKAKETLVRFAKLHKDDKIEKALNNTDIVRVHASCRRDFTNLRRLSSVQEPPSKKRKLRSEVNFNLVSS